MLLLMLMLMLFMLLLPNNINSVERHMKQQQQLSHYRQLHTHTNTHTPTRPLSQSNPDETRTWRDFKTDNFCSRCAKPLPEAKPFKWRPTCVENQPLPSPFLSPMTALRLSPTTWKASQIVCKAKNPLQNKPKNATAYPATATASDSHSDSNADSVAAAVSAAVAVATWCRSGSMHPLPLYAEYVKVFAFCLLVFFFFI